MNFVKALNEIHTNIWALFIIAGGIVLCCCKQPALGSSIVTGGFAIINGSRQTATHEIEIEGVNNGTKS